MTYCLGIALNSGLVFASDSRTNAGSDQVSQYGKMHTMGIEGDRQVRQIYRSANILPGAAGSPA